MATAFNDVCRFNATAAGAGSFVVASASAGHLTPTQANATDGKTYHYFASSADGLLWEEGQGVWTAISQTLSRSAVINNSDETTARINFAAAPIVDMFPSPLPLEIPPAFPSGTLMLFQQSVAPVGWTKQTTHNDKALRVVSGSASSGGSNSFSSVMAQTTVGAHQLTIAEMPGHHHTDDAYIGGGGSSIGLAVTTDGLSLTHIDTTTVGGDGTHTHPITMGIQYVDLIICQKA